MFETTYMVFMLSQSKNVYALFISRLTVVWAESGLIQPLSWLDNLLLQYYAHA